MEILPPVTGADVARTGAAEGVGLGNGGSRERQRIRSLRRGEHPAPGLRRHLRSIAAAGAAEVRREQGVGAQIRIPRKRHVDHQHVALRAGDDAQRELESRVPVHDAHRRNSGSEQLHRMLPQPLHLHPEPVAVGDDEAEIPDLWNVDARVIHLVHDAAADREPQARAAEGAPDHFLGAARPRGRHAGCAGCGAPCGRHRAHRRARCAAHRPARLISRR